MKLLQEVGECPRGDRTNCCVLSERGSKEGGGASRRNEE